MRRFKIDVEIARDSFIKSSGGSFESCSIDVESSISQDEAEKIALGRDRVKAHISGNNIKRVIYIDGKLINIVAS